MVIFSQKRNCVVHICLWTNQNELQILASKKNRSGFPFCFVARSVLLSNSVHPPYIKPGPAGTWAVTMPSCHCAKKIRFGRKWIKCKWSLSNKWIKMIMHSNNTNMSKGRLFIEFSRFYRSVKALYFKSAVIFRILILESSANKLSENKTN